MKFCHVSRVFLYLYACVHDEVMQALEVHQETGRVGQPGRAALFSIVEHC